MISILLKSIIRHKLDVVWPEYGEVFEYNSEDYN